MKVAYEKPMFRQEKFELTQNIAQDCGMEPGVGGEYGKHLHAHPDSCAWELYSGAGTVFYDTTGTCELNVEWQDIVCYNNPEGGQHVFGS